MPARLVVRRKNNVAGLWLNTSSATFDLVPSYYAIASTRPIDEITTEEFRASHGVGFQNLRFTPAFGQAQALSTEDLKEFRQAIVRLKQKQGLYVQDQYSVAFIGKSLFRATIELPANVTVGPFETRVYLFRDEKLLSQYTVRLNLEREGPGAASARLRVRLSDALRPHDGGDRDCRGAHRPRRCSARPLTERGYGIGPQLNQRRRMQPSRQRCSCDWHLARSWLFL